jgi:hypothetical protein
MKWQSLFPKGKDKGGYSSIKKSGRLDSNQRLLAPKASALNHAAPRPDKINVPYHCLFCNNNKGLL